jgi:hypothetical protein
MAEIYIQRNILVSYLIWYFFDIPKEILKGWKNFLVFNLNYFSIPILIKTFFSHWRQYKWSYGRGFDFKRYAEAFFSNMISRTLGAMVRSVLIFIGILTEILILIFGSILFLGWLILPAILIFGLIFGLKMIL